ncbi:MAG: hypothetical protein RR707_04960, partial [Comamonas sp.]
RIRCRSILSNKVWSRMGLGYPTIGWLGLFYFVKKAVSERNSVSTVNPSSDGLNCHVPDA